VYPASGPSRTIPANAGPGSGGPKKEKNDKLRTALTQIENDHNPFSFEYVNLA
jgi:hypothetical protein